MGWEKATPGRGRTRRRVSVPASSKAGKGSHRTSGRVDLEVPRARLRGGRRRVSTRGLTPNQEAALLSRRGAGGAARRRLGMAGEL